MIGQEKNKKLLIGLIHNNQKDRVQNIKPKIEELAKELGKENMLLDVEYYESFYQAKNLKQIGVSRFVCIFKYFLYWRTDRLYKDYRLLKNRFIGLDILNLIYKTFFWFILNKNLYKRFSKNYLIEIFLLDKHIQIYRHALEIDADYVLVFEDDAVFKKDSIIRMKKVFNLVNSVSEKPIYCDLAGGLKIEELVMDNLEVCRDEDFIQYKKPTTNTTCCYLINSKQLNIILDYINIKPHLRYMTPDLFLNNIFLLQENDFKDSFCTHSFPSIFIHGSVEGNFQSNFNRL